MGISVCTRMCVHVCVSLGTVVFYAMEAEVMSWPPNCTPSTPKLVSFPNNSLRSQGPRVSRTHPGSLTVSRPGHNCCSVLGKDGKGYKRGKKTDILGADGQAMCQYATKDLKLIRLPGRAGGLFLSPGPKSITLGCHGGRSRRGSHPFSKRPLSSEQPGVDPGRVIEGDEQHSWHLLLKTHNGKYLKWPTVYSLVELFKWLNGAQVSAWGV